MSRKCVFVYLTIVILALTAYWYLKPESEQQTLRIGIATWPGFAPGFVAVDQGFFGDLKVEFFILDDFAARQNAFTSGRTQGTISTFDSYAFEKANGVEGKAVMVLDESNGADGIVSKVKIETAADLTNKKIAYTRGSPAHFFLIHYLRKYDLTLKDIKTIEVDDPGRAGEAFLSGDVDLAVTWEPYLTNISEKGKGVIVETTATAPEQIVDVMVFSDSIIKDHPELVKKFIMGWYEAVDFVKRNPEKAYQIMGDALKIDPSELKQMATGLKFANLERSKYYLLPKIGSRGAAIFNEASSIWMNEGLVKDLVKSKDALDPQFID